MKSEDLAEFERIGFVQEMELPPPVSEVQPTKNTYTVQEMLSQAKERAFSKAPERVCTTGMWDLDDATGGIQPGFGWVLGADTNWGKSMMLTMIADENLRLGRNVLIVSAEDPPELYGRRLLARRAQVNAKRLRDRKLTAEEVTAVVHVLGRAEKRVAFLDARDMKAEQIAKAVTGLMQAHDIDLVMYDYLQEFRSSGRHQDRRNEVSEVAKMLRAPVKAAGRASIIASQITIDKTKKHPDKHSIRESRDVSNAAEVIVLGYCPEEGIIGNDGRPVVEPGGRALYIDKVKDGATGFAIGLNWNKESACFDAKPNPYDRADNIINGPSRGVSDMPDWEDG